MEEDKITENLFIQLITDGKDKSEVIPKVEGFLKGGGRWIQLRMKNSPEEEIVRTGHNIRELCDKYGAIFIMNDNPYLAQMTSADGVHLGKNDIAPDKARVILGNRAVIGCTANTFEDIVNLIKSGIDYIGLGPFRFTTTKKNLSPVLGIEGYKDIFRQMNENNINIPVVAIGGIVLEDIPALIGSGVRNIAVSGAVNNSSDPQKITEKFIELLKNNI
ncbi:MAG: thiamine phosphate synthase [Rikenellaceae bacterium]|nr:thiamine phosphate synthase [Rikenellaceae bacterium]